MSFSTALTGLNASTSDLSVISNNVANSNTIGFKNSRAEFTDLFYSANGIGRGTQLAAVTQQFEQGGINATGNPLDLAISGNGFFRLNDNGSIIYGRAGAFTVDREGYIVNSQNQRLTGYTADVNGNVTDILGDMQLDSTAIEPNPTSEITFGLNLSADAEAIDTTATPFDPTNPDSYNFSTSVTVYDSLGISHTMTAYFTKPDPTANDWEAHFTLDGGVPFDNTTTPPTPTTYGPETLSFDDQGALLPGTGIINLAGIDPDNSAATLDLNLDFTETSQYGGQFSTQNLVQDGFSSGLLIAVEVAEDGVIFGRYNNGQSRALGQVVLADFNNVQGLSTLGDTTWAESPESGPALLGKAGTGKLGLIRSAALESSNVDLTKELVNMISAQRNFQANAQVINAADSLTQTIVNLR